MKIWIAYNVKENCLSEFLWCSRLGGQRSSELDVLWSGSEVQDDRTEGVFGGQIVHHIPYVLYIGT